MILLFRGVLVDHRVVDLKVPNDEYILGAIKKVAMETQGVE